MHAAIQKFDPERLSLASGRFGCWDRVRCIAMGFCAAAIAAFFPSVSEAGVIVDFHAGCVNGSQHVACDAFGVSLGQDFWADSGTPASPERAVLEKQQPEPEKQQQEVPQIDPAMDLEEGGTTSAPEPGGGSSAPVAVSGDAVAVASSTHMQRVRVLEDLILDSPSPLGLLDPPKA